MVDSADSETADMQGWLSVTEPPQMRELLQEDQLQQLPSKAFLQNNTETLRFFGVSLIKEPVDHILLVYTLFYNMYNELASMKFRETQCYF